MSAGRLTASARIYAIILYSWQKLLLASTEGRSMLLEVGSASTERAFDAPGCRFRFDGRAFDAPGSRFRFDGRAFDAPGSPFRFDGMTPPKIT